ncbi:methyl-accepting chemotaxis protein [Desulfobacula sp.]|uniref:methyl-accepting chemotaxis protein n=1 Tax=Desulfobacula sp. TaxID=2593537 RepID=UPI0026326CB1|nr:methyl-accepting chemotaxis protein [Desulfobacula sp.]
MNWKNMTIGKKIGTGFGVIIIFLIVMGVISFTDVGGIVKNAEEVIDGNKLDGNLAQKEVDHLNWANRINALLTDEKVTSLDVQTDDHKCGFGKWLYGDGRKHAEGLVPSLTPLLKEIETPHHELHQSAVEIKTVFKQPHMELALTLSNRLTDHVHWVGTLGKALASEAGGLYSYQTQLKNSVDQAISAIGTIHETKQFSSLEEIKAAAAINIGRLRYGDGRKDYLFILDESTKMVMHPIKPELNSKDMSESKDPKGKRVFAEMVRISKENGKGFLTYDWPLTGSSEIAPKISYVKVYKPFGWIIGTSVYIDHTNHTLIKRAHEFVEGKLFTTGVQTDPTKCAFGKFLNDPKTNKMAAEFPELKAALDAIGDPHKKLHETAVHIKEKVNHLKMHEAIHIFNEETQAALDEVKKHFNSAIAAEKNLQQGMDDANRIYAEKTLPSLQNVQTLLGKIRNTARENIMTDQVMLNAAQSTKRKVAIVAGIAILAGLLLAFIIARGIVSVLKNITVGMGEGANQVAAASGQVSSSSQSMAEGASEQAASIEETSSSMEEMSSMTKRNAENATQADTLMKEANHVVKTADESMDQLIVSMQEISKASEETSKIIKTIDEIAFQTNLLALNAAVEAARAGEAGAGFAVVADEVRNLAMRAADAAKSTAELIEGTVKKVNDGSQLVTTTNDAFTQVAESSGKVGSLIAEISEASKEQSDGIEQVNIAITEMDKVVQQNAANAEESASASEEMNAQAEQLRDYVGDLMMMITGKRDQNSVNGKKIVAQKVSHRLSVSGPGKKKMLSRDTKEIRPDQVIPFDDDENFENF